MRETQSEAESNNNNSNNGYWTQQPPQALLERLKDYGQEDAFSLWDELSADERSFLVKDIEVISLPSPPPPLPSRSLYISLSKSWFFFFQFTLIWRLGRKQVFWNMNVAFFTGGFFRFFSRAKHCIKKKKSKFAGFEIYGFFFSCGFYYFSGFMGLICWRIRWRKGILIILIFWATPKNMKNMLLCSSENNEKKKKKKF